MQEFPGQGQQNQTTNQPRFIAGSESHQVYHADAYHKLIDNAEKLQPNDVITMVDQSLAEAAKYMIDMSKPHFLRRAVSYELQRGLTADSLGQISELLNKIASTFVDPPIFNKDPLPEELEYKNNYQRALKQIRYLQRVVDKKREILAPTANQQAEVQPSEHFKARMDKFNQKQEEKNARAENSDEKERLRERAAEIVLQDGGVIVHTSLPKDLSPKSNAGFQNLNLRVNTESQMLYGMSTALQQLISNSEARYGRRPNEVVAEKGIREIIDFRYIYQPEMQSITIPGNKGILGIGKTPDRVEQKPTGRQIPVYHNQKVMDGKNEPAVKVTYAILQEQLPRDNSPESLQAYQQSTWRDYSGRGGQMLNMEVILPESAARELEQIIDKDPAAIRKVLDKVMTERMLRDPSEWRKQQGSGDTLRPPYERWDNLPDGGKIYVQKENQEQGFHQENFKHV